MTFELRYKQNDARFGRVELNSIGALRQAFGESNIDIDFASGTIWLYTFVYEEPSFSPEEHSLRECENGTWEVLGAADASERQTLVLDAYGPHGQYLGRVEAESLEELAEAYAGRRINVWLEEQKLNILPAE